METEIFIFHETQDSLLCGQHCLNNLLQQPIFNFIDLSNIAIELSELEKNLLNENNHSKSLKNDDTGGTTITL
jgi:ataxin-3